MRSPLFALRMYITYLKIEICADNIIISEYLKNFGGFRRCCWIANLLSGVAQKCILNWGSNEQIPSTQKLILR